MKKQKILRVLFGGIIALSSTAWATTYKVTNLSAGEPLGQKRANDINNFGAVVGLISLEPNLSTCTVGCWANATLWLNGTTTNLGTIDGGSYSIAHGINDTGNVVGYGYMPGTNTLRPLLWDDGVATGLSVGSIPGTSGYAYKINNVGQAVGSVSSGGYDRAVLWADGVAVPLSTGVHSFATSINNSGQIVGYDHDYSRHHSPSGRAAIWDGGPATDLSSYSSVASSINDAGQIVGSYSSEGMGVKQAILWSGGTSILLQGLGGLNSTANDINNSGQIVGSSSRSDYFNSDSYATLWVENVPFDLNQLANLTGTGFSTLSVATAINDRGQIVGYGRNVMGREDAFLLTPSDMEVSEPSSSFLVLLGLVLFGSSRVSSVRGRVIEN